MVKALQTRLPPISRKKKRRGDIRAYISRGGTEWLQSDKICLGRLHVVEGLIRCEIQQEDSNSRRIQVNDKHVIFFVDCDGSGVKFVHAAAKTVSVTMIFRFTSRHISELKAKAKANSEVAGSDVDLKISSFQAVLAHMWRSIIRNSRLNPEEVTHCNMRQRLNPPIGLATATTSSGEMLNNGLG
ncbi:hypothetical protein YC2023_026201 [Brassica napus]